MLALRVDGEASPGVVASVYERRRPERTVLYHLVGDYYRALKTRLSAQGPTLPGYVEGEFDAYLRWGRLEHGFVRVRCESGHAEQLVAFSGWFSAGRRGLCPSCRARRSQVLGIVRRCIATHLNSGIIGVLCTSVAIGTLVGPSFTGFVYDRAQDYAGVMLFGEAMAAIGIGFTLDLPDPKRWSRRWHSDPVA